MSCPPMRITKRSLESALQSYDFSAKYANLTALLPAVDRYSVDSFSHYTTIASLPGGAVNVYGIIPDTVLPSQNGMKRLRG